MISHLYWKYSGGGQEEHLPDIETYFGYAIDRYYYPATGVTVYVIQGTNEDPYFMSLEEIKAYIDSIRPKPKEPIDWVSIMLIGFAAVVGISLIKGR